MTPFYVHSDVVHNMTSPRQVVPIVFSMLRPTSVLDVGCGTGTWLKAFEEAGVDDYLGIDGDYVERSKLKIPSSKFVPFDISRPVDLGRKFDLVVSLEVVEHLAPQSADVVVESLVRHGETILFSAAIPGQGGQNHLNEQWPKYWENKFKDHGFYFHDLVRPNIWNDDRVEWWYRQNIFLINRERSNAAIMDVVHPELLALKTKAFQDRLEVITNGRLGITPSIRIVMSAIKYRFLGR